MFIKPSSCLSGAALCAALALSCFAQDANKPLPEKAAQKATGTLSVDAKLVVVPAVVYDKKGLVTTLTQNDFAITVDGRPQSVRYFDRDTDVPLTVGLLVDISRSQTSVLDDEQKASQKFLESLLKPASGSRPADKAFLLQFAHSAELLQDVTESRPLLAAGLKEIGTQAPGATDDDNATDTVSSKGSSDPNAGGNGSPNGNGNGGYGPYGRRSGSPGNGGNGGGSSRDNGARSGTVLYDALYLSSGDVLGKQKGRRALILLTDGVDRHSKESLTDAIEAAQRADTVVYAIYYKGREPHGPYDRQGGGYPGGGGGYPGYGGGYPGYGHPGYPGSGGRPGSDGTYAEPDGKKILQRICAETGGHMYEVKGKGSVDAIYAQIGDELRAQYRLGFTPSLETSSAGFHPIQLTLTGPDSKKLDVQTRAGFYAEAPRSH